jgi:hypothetical protein
MDDGWFLEPGNDFCTVTMCPAGRKQCSRMMKRATDVRLETPVDNCQLLCLEKKKIKLSILARTLTALSKRKDEGTLKSDLQSSQAKQKLVFQASIACNFIHHDVVEVAHPWMQSIDQ